MVPSRQHRVQPNGTTLAKGQLTGLFLADTHHSSDIVRNPSWPIIAGPSALGVAQCPCACNTVSGGHTIGDVRPCK
jgi:hypothetical protein